VHSTTYEKEMGDDDKELELGSYGMERRLGGRRRPMVVPTYWCAGEEKIREKGREEEEPGAKRILLLFPLLVNQK
jgi:hypothetical protein